MSESGFESVTGTATERSDGVGGADLGADGDERLARAIERGNAEREARARTDQLQLVTSALASALSPADVGHVIASHGAAACGAVAGAVWVLDLQRSRLQHVASVGLPESVVQQFAVIALDAALPAAEIIRTGRSFFAQDAKSTTGEYPVVTETLDRMGREAWAGIPLRFGNELLGCVAFTFAERRHFDTDDIAFLETIAAQGAQALERSRLFESEQRARRRAAFLSEASRRLSESLDVEATVQRAAAVLVPEMADWCIVDLLHDDNVVEMAAVAHVDAARAKWARHVRAQHPVRLDDPIGLGKVLRTGTSEFIPRIDATLLEAAAKSPDELEALQAFTLTSFVCVPLTVGGAVIGALTLARSRAESPYYDAADLELAEELGRRTATAIEHSRAYQRAQQASQAKSEFLAVMSHELRTPLNAIGGYAELLRLGVRGPITDAQRADLDRIDHSQRHLLGLINQVLNYARIDARAVEYAMGPVPIAAALVDAASLVEPQAKARGLGFATSVCDAAVVAQADSEKLQQILLNLLTNAIKFTHAGGRITLACAANRESVHIFVTDTGVGIPPDKLARIFEPFVQVNQALTRSGDGVGLGLAISRELAHGMGGTLTVSSRVDEGSTFTLTLRRADP